jgi:hypothetical protein
VGAGAGNVLTKATKWAAVAFFALVIVLSVLYSRSAGQDSLRVSESLKQSQPSQSTPVAMPALTNEAALTTTNAASPESSQPGAEANPAETPEQ